MYSGIHRVISESDELGENVGGERAGATAASDTAFFASGSAHAGTGGQQHPQQPLQSAGVASVFVEPDNRSDAMDVDAPVSLVPSGASDICSSNSSLSDTSGVDVTMDREREQHQITPPAEYVVGLRVPGVAQRQHVNMRRIEGRGLQRYDSGGDSSAESHRASSQTSSRDWGWFEDVHISEHPSSHDRRHFLSSASGRQRGGLVPLVPQLPGAAMVVPDIIPQNKGNEPAMAVTAPPYVLEESLSSQRLWKDTAGQRPPQPVEERVFYEKMWAQNFARSQVKYSMPVEVLTATSPISLSPFADGNFAGPSGETDISNYNLAAPPSTQQDAKADVAEAALVERMNDPSHARDGLRTQCTVNKKVKGTGSDGDLTVLDRGDNVFGTTVSKSFAKSGEKGGPLVGVDTVNISIASYRVVESRKYGKYAQFLVIYREGGIRDTVGVWKRYRDFEDLARTVTQAHEGCAAVIANISPVAVTEEPETEHLPNAITSWRLLKKRQRWYRCLDAGYLSLKVFLLERFLHDILFESSSPNLLREFVGADSVM